MSQYIENQILNTKTSINHIDEIMQESITLTQMNISKYYSHVFLLVKKNMKPIHPDFYNYQVQKDIYDSVCDNLLIHKVSVHILKNKNHFDNIIIMSRNQLNKFNMFDYELEESNIMVPILNISFQNLQ